MYLKHCLPPTAIHPRNNNNQLTDERSKFNKGIAPIKLVLHQPSLPPLFRAAVIVLIPCALLWTTSLTSLSFRRKSRSNLFRHARIEWMELECVENLELDTLPPRAPHLDSPLHLKRPLLSSPLHHPNSLNSRCIHPPEFSITRTSSPLTQSPSPSPKRRRITSPHASSPSTISLARPASTHPLATLCSRDIKHVIGRINHLADTVVTTIMREEVVAWCADMVTDLQLPEAIVAIAINLFDRFIARQPVSKSMLYALSASCLLLASKITLDDDVPLEEISARARVPPVEIHLMEVIILNVLEWSVNVVTPHEVVNELNADFTHTEATDHVFAIQDSLMLNALLDYRLANLRATSIGVACHILAANVAAGCPYADHTTHPTYHLASVCNINLTEVEFCVGRLRANLSSLFGIFEDLDSEEDEESF